MSINLGLEWWREAKFGLFIHWGLYALLAGEYRGQRTHNIAEWIMHDLRISPAEYEQLAARFNPADFDADAIAALAAHAGMRYVVLTAKHHDGFAMYHSRANPYNVVDATPFGRDVAQELRRACDRHGLRLCFYYSQAQDWHHPGGIEQYVSDPNPGFDDYLARKCIPQLEELLTNYGDLGLIWFDTPMSMTREQSRLLRDLVKQRQPQCLVSGRIGHGLGDYMTTGDNFIPLLPYDGPFEVPATINRTWGYSRFDTDWKPAGHLLRDLVRVVSRGGNYLLNIGPDALGRVPEESAARLRAIGEFLSVNGESIYGTHPVPAYPYDMDGLYFTARPGRLYIHCFTPRRSLYLINMMNRPLAASLLADGRPLTLRERRTCEGVDSWTILLPDDLPPQLDTVICVDIAEEQVQFEPITG
ncbi:MAG: hypothetical protein GX653_08685 [Clostridiales bacterium]|nr:hypothetical protein [Clostridiales bacterium]